MEEDIKVLEELKETYITSGLYEIGTFELSEEEKQAIENLIKGYKEIKEENEKFYNGELYTAKQLKNYEKTIKTYWVNKKIIKEIAEDYESKGYIEIAGAMRELLEERN